MNVLEQISDEEFEMLYAGELNSDDFAWLKELGANWTEDDIEASNNLLILNELVIIGSQNIQTETENNSGEEILQARLDFFAKLPAVKQKALDSYPGSKSLMPLINFVENQRILFAQGIDLSTVNNTKPAVMGFTPESLRIKIDNLINLGVGVRRIVNKNPTILGLAPESVVNKFSNIHNLGLNEISVVDRRPILLNLSEELFQDRFNNIASKGINAVDAINKDPSIICCSIETFNKKMNIFYAAARSWGWDTYREAINHIVENCPTLLTYKPTKLRTLVRIATDGLISVQPEQIKIADIQTLTYLNLEAALSAYLINKDSPMQLNELRTIGIKHSRLSKQALRMVISKNLDNRAVKTYLRGYPLDK